jgi:hypothetical protein
VKFDLSVMKFDFVVIKFDFGVVKSDVAVVKFDLVVIKFDLPVMKFDLPVSKFDFGVVKSDFRRLSAGKPAARLSVAEATGARQSGFPVSRNPGCNRCSPSSPVFVRVGPSNPPPSSSPSLLLS